MAVRLAQRRGFDRRTFELEGARLLVTEAGPFSRRQVRVPAEVVFGDRDELRRSSWVPAAVGLFYAFVTVAAFLDADRDLEALISSPIIVVVCALWFWSSRKLYRRYSVGGSSVAFLAGGRRDAAIDEFVGAAQVELRAWLRPRILPFRTTGNLLADRERIEWLHDHGIVTDDERAAIVLRLERMVRAAIAVDRAAGHGGPDARDEDDDSDTDEPAAEPALDEMN